MTKFKIKFKGRLLPKVIHADSYFISERETNGYTRMVFFNTLPGGKKKHVLVCNAKDTWYATLDE